LGRKKKLFIINNYLEKMTGKNDTEILKNGDTKEQNFKHSPEELFPNELLGQNKTTPDLVRFIKRETEKGNSNIIPILTNYISVQQCQFLLLFLHF
jgi:lipopolysaccharide export system permease protein